MIVLDEDAGGEVDAVVGASAALDRVFLKDAQAGDGLAGVEDAGMGALNGVNIGAGEGGDAAEVLHQVEDDALATEEYACVVADDGEDLARVHADAVEDFVMADDFKAGLRLGMRVELRVRMGVETGKDFKQAGDRAEAADDHVLAGDDGGGGAQVGIDGEVGGSVAGGLVFNQGLLQQCVDAGAFPIHKSVVSCQ